jgi:hypothetical protein
MKKFLLFFITAISSLLVKAEINIWGSAVYLTVNGTAAFYNTRQLTPPYAIGDLPFQNNLGVFGKNSGNLKITGAEINISSTPNNVAGAKVFYLIYKHGERPLAPVFTSFSLQAYCKCNGSSFSTCGGRACDDINDQKFQIVNQSIDLTELETGTYSIELYFTANSSSEQGVDDNGANNYKADFIITAPLPVNIISLRGSAGDEDIVIRWQTENDINITRYEVEKSLNGLSFVPLQSIISFQNPSVSNYYLDDNAPVIGTNYYRIKSYNINGAVAVSNVFRIYYGKVGNTVLIYPNPVDGELVVRLAGIQKGEYGISVLGTNGQTITAQSIFHDGQDKTIRISLPAGMQRGVYKLFLIDKYKFYKQSFMVK